MQYNWFFECLSPLKRVADGLLFLIMLLLNYVRLVINLCSGFQKIKKQVCIVFWFVKICFLFVKLPSSFFRLMMTMIGSNSYTNSRIKATYHYHVLTVTLDRASPVTTKHVNQKGLKSYHHIILISDFILYAGGFKLKCELKCA